jgi:hypothetical protein
MTTLEAFELVMLVLERAGTPEGFASGDTDFAVRVVRAVQSDLESKAVSA